MYINTKYKNKIDEYLEHNDQKIGFNKIYIYINVNKNVDGFLIKTQENHQNWYNTTKLRT